MRMDAAQTYITAGMLNQRITEQRSQFEWRDASFRPLAAPVSSSRRRRRQVRRQRLPRPRAIRETMLLIRGAPPRPSASPGVAPPSAQPVRARDPPPRHPPPSVLMIPSVETRPSAPSRLVFLVGRKKKTKGCYFYLGKKRLIFSLYFLDLRRRHHCLRHLLLNPLELLSPLPTTMEWE